MEGAVIDRAADAIEVREQQVAVHESIDPFVPYGLLERAQGIARCGEELAPSPTPHNGDRCAGAVSLRADREVDRRVGASRRGNGELLSYRELAVPRTDPRFSPSSDRKRREPRKRGALEE